MRISAIVPLYNGAAFIEQAIRSILDQDRPADEIIIVDDGSTDNSAAIVQAIADRDARIQLLRKENGGQGSARNHGIRHASGDLIALLDQDDFWYENHLRELERPFIEKAERRLAYVYSNLDQIDGAGRMVQHGILRLTPRKGRPRQNIVDCLKQDMFVLPGASLIDRTAFLAVGGFDERLTGYEDDDLFRRLFSAGYNCVFIDKPLTSWRVHSSSTSFSIRMWTSRAIYFEKLVSEFSQGGDEHQGLVANYIAPRFAKNGFLDVKSAFKANDLHAFNIAVPIARRYASHLNRKAARRLQNRISKYVFLFKMRRAFNRLTGNTSEKTIPRNLGFQPPVSTKAPTPLA